MNRVIPLILCGMAVSSVAGAQGFRELDLNTMDFRTGELDIDQASNVWRFTGGADIVLHSADAAEGSMRVRARTIVIERAPGGENEVRAVRMEGNVIVEHPDGTIRADRGDWNVQTSELVFTGSPTLSMDLAQEVQSDRIEINLREGRYRLPGAAATGVRLGGLGSGGPGNPFRFRADSVTDWPALIGALQAQHASEAPSPGKRILALVDPRVREALPNLAADPIDDFKNAIIGQLNRVLSQPTLYTAEAWQGIDVPADAQAFIDKGISTLSEQELTHLNRRLLEAAYPAAIAPAP